MGSFAQKVNVREYVRQVYDYSLDIKSSKENVDASHYLALEAEKNFLPRLDAVVNGNYTFRDYSLGGMVTMQHYGVNAGVNLSQNIYNGSMVKHSVGAARTQTDIARYSQLLTVENVVLAASNIYWRAVAAEAYRNVAKRYLTIIKSNYDLLNIRFKDGIAAKTDLLMMQTRLKQAEYNLTQSEKAVEQALININIFRGVDVKTEVAFADSIIVENAAIPALKNVNDVVQNRNEFNIANLSVNQSIAQMKINRAKFLPALSVGVGGTYGTRMINIDGEFVVDGSAFLKFTAPIFGWGQKRNRRLSDQAKINSAQYNLTQTCDDITKEVNSSYVSLLESYEQLDVTSSSLDIAQQSLELNIFSYDEGMISVVELLSAQLSWLSAYNNKIQANLTYRVTLLAYQKALGELMVSK
ncbi:MAG: TolC family protein [Rikenellaceae bacterium]